MRYTSLIIIMLLISADISAQKEIKYSRQGNKEYSVNSFDDAELLYRRSFDENPAYSDAMFNLGTALYKQEKYQDAQNSFETLANSEIDPVNKSASYYNLGNTLLKDNKLKESIESYKNSLRLDPGNIKAKYNLAYAQDQLKKQEQQQQQQEQNNNQDKEQNQEQNQNKQGENNQDQQDQQDQQNKQDQQKDDNQQNNQQQQDKMSKQDAERLLQALAADEQEVQEKVKEAKASERRVRTLKNW